MKDDDVKNRFVELRAKNWSYKRIADELRVSKQTLINWSRELSHVISNLRVIELEELQDKHYVLREKRIELFGELLKSIKAELDKRDLKDLTTEKLFLLLLRYAEALKAESLVTSFSVEESGGLELLGEMTRTSSWRA
jgi:hypothetical protein